MEGLGAILCFEAFDIDDVGVPFRLAANHSLLLVAEPLVEHWRLEAVCREDYLLAASAHSLHLGCLEQRSAETTPAVGLMHPQMCDHAATSPRMAIECRDDFSRLASQATAHEPTVEVTG